MKLELNENMEIAETKELLELVDKINTYIEENPIEIYVDYRDEVQQEDVSSLLEGNKTLGDISMEIEENYIQYYDGTENDYYFDELAETLELDRKLVEFLRDDYLEQPYSILTEQSMEQLLGNTSCHIQAVLEGINVYNEAETLEERYSELFSIVPKDFLDLEQLEENGYSFSDSGQLVFLLNDITEVLAAKETENDFFTFSKGTSLFLYDFFNGCGLTETELTKDFTVLKSKVSFFNDNTDKYGIDSCYGLVESVWNGSVA